MSTQNRLIKIQWTRLWLVGKSSQTLEDCFPPHPERDWHYQIEIQFSPLRLSCTIDPFLLAAAIDIFVCIIVAASTKGWSQSMLLARWRKSIAMRFPTNGTSYSEQHDSTKRGCSTAVENIMLKKIYCLGVSLQLEMITKPTTLGPQSWGFDSTIILSIIWVRYSKLLQILKRIFSVLFVMQK